MSKASIWISLAAIVLSLGSIVVNAQSMRVLRRASEQVAEMARPCP